MVHNRSMEQQHTKKGNKQQQKQRATNNQWQTIPPETKYSGSVAVASFFYLENDIFSFYFFCH